MFLFIRNYLPAMTLVLRNAMALKIKVVENQKMAIVSPKTNRD